MSIRTIPGERYTDRGAVLTYDRLDRTALPVALIEPKSVGPRQWVAADMAAIVATAPIGTFGTVTKSGGDLTVTRQTHVELSDTDLAPVGLILSAQVMVDQRHAKVVYRGYIKSNDTGGGIMVLTVNILAFNICTTDATIVDASTINYVIVRKRRSTQPTSPTATLDVTQAKHWKTANEPLTAGGLNLMAAPTAAIRPNSIGETEIDPTALDGLAASLVGLRASYTVPTTFSVSTRDAANVTTSLNVPGAVVAGSVVRVSAFPPNPVPLFTGFVSAADTVTIQVRLNNFSGTSVHSGTILRVLVLQP